MRSQPRQRATSSQWREVSSVLRILLATTGCAYSMLAAPGSGSEEDYSTSHGTTAHEGGGGESE